MRQAGCRCFARELTTVSTTTMTTVEPRDTYTYTYTTTELASCLFTPSARAYGSKGYGFEAIKSSTTELCAAIGLNNRETIRAEATVSS